LDNTRQKGRDISDSVTLAIPWY